MHRATRARREFIDIGAVDGPIVSAAGCPIRFDLGGVVGSRFWGMHPRPSTSDLWSQVNEPSVNARRVSTKLVDSVLFGAHALAARAKPDLSGGRMAVYVPQVGAVSAIRAGDVGTSKSYGPFQRSSGTRTKLVRVSYSFALRSGLCPFCYPRCLR